MDIFYHLTSKNIFQNNIHDGYYKHKSLIDDGFIHCCTRSQINIIFDLFYRNVNEDVIVLCINSDELKSKFVFEFSNSLNEYFPHIYGAINLNAVIEINRIEDFI